MEVIVKRLQHNPIVSPQLDKSLGDSISGPFLIKVPDWIDEPLGRYYLYFAHHDHGQHIRLAYSDHLQGPWKVYRPGTLNTLTLFVLGISRHLTCT